MGEKIGVQLFLCAARGRCPIVYPAHSGRQRHEDRLDTSNARLQAEKRAAVEHEVKFDVTSTPVFLKLSLFLRVFGVFSFLDNRDIGLEITVCKRLYKVETLIEAHLVKVIEKQAAYPSCLAAMLEKEILVAALFEGRIVSVAKGCAGSFGCAVPVYAVFFEAVVGR